MDYYEGKRREVWACSLCSEARRARKKVIFHVREGIKHCIPPLYQQASYKDISSLLTGAIRAASPHGFVLYGPPGTGKTHVACAYIRAWLASTSRHANLDRWDYRHTIRRITWDMLLLQIRSCFKDGSGSSELDVIKPYMSAGLLVLEDVGATTGMSTMESDFSLRVFMVLLDHRIENGLPTCITTNKTREAFGRSFNPRISSRLSLFTWLGIGGGDKRIGAK